MRTHKQSIKTTLEEMIDGREATIEFTRVTEVSHDPNADCDADGNRGHAVDYIDEDYAEDVTVQFGDNPVAIFTLDGLSEGTRALVIVALDTYLATHEPECEENDSDRYDEDWRSER